VPFLLAAVCYGVASALLYAYPQLLRRMARVPAGFPIEVDERSAF